MSENPNREETLFADALARPREQRAAFLAQACGTDAALLVRVVALLAAEAETVSLMAGPPAVSPAMGKEGGAGDHLGHYKLLQQIGEGGCGVVWMAEQEEPVRRRVALKVIKLGMDTKAVVARFEAERQALAMMDHPNIAKVHDAGATETGRPFFVMELVRGIPITKYCDENHLDPTARLELFIKVCQAVQHAHQKGIIHRDLKPSNILVTVNDGAATPKIIDFGIAKATQGKLTDATVFTAFEQFIGTPVYMSPEQAEMSSLDIDTRSDIYSLGVLLYELLTGRPPFDPKAFAQAGVDQVRKQIREIEPPRPSARLSTLDADERTTIAKLRGTAASNLSLILRGDLDWIVMRCLEKDRTRRYDTANGLAADIQRYLCNEPVVARPPSTGYLLQKLIRRHKFSFAAGATVAVVIITGMVVSLWQRGQALRARDDADTQRALAETARNEAEKLAAGLLQQLHEDSTSSLQFQTVVKLADQVVAYYNKLPSTLVRRETRRNRSTALMWTGRALFAQSETRRATPILDRAVLEFEALRADGDTAPETTLGLALSLAVRGANQFQPWGLGAPDLDRAVGLLRPTATAAGADRHIQLEFANILNWWSFSQSFERGVVGCSEARAVLTRLGALDARNPDATAAAAYGDAADTEAWLSLTLGRFDDAARLGREMQALSEKTLARSPGDLGAIAVRGWAHDKLYTVAARRFHATASRDLAAKLERATDEWVASNPSFAWAWAHRVISRQQMAEALLAHGQVTSAAAKLQEAITLSRQAPRGATAQWRTPFVWYDLATLAAQQGDRSAAERALDEAARAWEALNVEMDATPFGRSVAQEYLEQFRRAVSSRFQEYAKVEHQGKKAVARIDNLAKRADLPPARKTEIDALHRSARMDVAKSSLRLGRLAEAEQAAHEAATNPQGDGVYANLETNRAEAQAWCALAIARQGRPAEARSALAPVLHVYRNRQKNGAQGLGFDTQLAFCLYIQAIASADDPAGRAQRGAALDEAAQLLDRLSNEARALHDVRELIEMIAAERGR